MPSPRRPAVADLPPVQAPDSTPDPDPATENIESPVPEAASPSEATTTSPVVTILEAQVETTDEPEEEINFRRSPSFRAPRLHGGLLPHAPSSSSSSPTQRNATPPAGGSNTLPGVPLPPEMMAEWADLRSQHSSLLTSHSSLQSNLTQLRTEMTDLQRVNAQLMEENESYELLVGEKTLKGELDLKALLRRSYSSDTEGDGGSDDGEGLRSFSTTGTSVGSGARLEEVKEEDEDNLSDGDGTPNPNTSASGIDDDVEKMILETQGSGSRSTGAVEAETTSAKKKKLPPRAGQKTTQPMGLGLDLAAELEKAEEGEQATKEVEEKKALRRQQARQGSASTPGGEVAGASLALFPEILADTSTRTVALRAEIKSLKDANKALSLYISKIIDRIVAMDGFEKVLSADYKSASPPATQSAFGAAALKGSRSESKATSVSVAPAASLKSPVPVEPKQPVKRMSLGTWTLSPTALFGGVGSSKSAPPVPPAGMKPLRLVNPSTPREASPPVGTPSVGTPSVGTEGEDEEDAKERERLRAEMKLHGIEKTTTAPRLDAPLPPAPAGIEQTLDAGSDAASLKTSTSSRASRRTSGFYAPSPQIPFTSYSTGDSPPLGPGSASTTVTGATVLKREEDREREIRANLEKGNAGGFTEIRGHRRRPSNPRSGSSTPSMISISRGTPEPDAGRRSVSPMIMSPSLDGPQAPTPTAATAPSAVPAVTSPSLEAGETPESMFSRAARRISFNWAAKAPEVPPKTDEA